MRTFRRGLAFAGGACEAHPYEQCKYAAYFMKNLRAWSKITDDENISLAMMRSIIGGFQQSDQEELRAPYAERYFATVLPFWESRPLDLGLAFTGGMYPRLYTEDIVRSTDALLEKDVPPPVRRLLLEAKDEKQRVMRARAVDR